MVMLDGDKYLKATETWLPKCANAGFWCFSLNPSSADELKGEDELIKSKCQPETGDHNDVKSPELQKFKREGLQHWSVMPGEIRWWQHHDLGLLLVQNLQVSARWACDEDFCGFFSIIASPKLTINNELN